MLSYVCLATPHAIILFQNFQVHVLYFACLSGLIVDIRCGQQRRSERSLLRLHPLCEVARHVAILCCDLIRSVYEHILYDYQSFLHLSLIWYCAVRTYCALVRLTYATMTTTSTPRSCRYIV